MIFDSVKVRKEVTNMSNRKYEVTVSEDGEIINTEEVTRPTGIVDSAINSVLGDDSPAERLISWAVRDRT